MLSPLVLCLPVPPKLGGWGSEPLCLSRLFGLPVPPKLGGWGSEPLCLSRLFGLPVPPKLGGWGSEPPYTPLQTLPKKGLSNYARKHKEAVTSLCMSALL